MTDLQAMTDAPDLFADGLDLMLHGVQLLVRLHRHHLLFVLVLALLRGDQVLVD